MYKQEKKTDRVITLREEDAFGKKQFAFPLATFSAGFSRINVCLDDRCFVFYQLTMNDSWGLATHIPLEIAEKLGSVVTLGLRRHECLDCKSKWIEPVRRNAENTTLVGGISGELLVECPWCQNKNCASEPVEFVYEHVR